MPLKIDEYVLRETAIFREILDDRIRSAGIAPDVAEGLRLEYLPPIPPEDDAALDSIAGLGVCIRGDCVVENPPYKTPDLITGGFLSGGNEECVYLADCKFNAKNPGRFFGNENDFRKELADKFLVIGHWDIQTAEKKFFVLFSQKNAEKAKSRLHKFRKASNGSDVFSVAETLTVCDLAEFRTYFD